MVFNFEIYDDIEISSVFGTVNYLFFKLGNIFKQKNLLRKEKNIITNPRRVTFRLIIKKKFQR